MQEKTKQNKQLIYFRWTARTSHTVTVS